MLRRTVLLALLLPVLAPASADAGSYRVFACAAGGANWGNGSWTGAPVTNFAVDTNCSPPEVVMGLQIPGNRQIPNGASASLTFTSPPGTAIADFAISRQLDFTSNPPLAGTRPLYAAYLLGSTVFAGAGDYDDATRNRLRASGSWYGFPAGNAAFTRRTHTLRQFGALAGYRGDARTLAIRVGCFRRGTTNCSAPAGGRVNHVLYGADVTVSDPTPPAPTVAAEGLLAGGQRHGADPVVLSATDNTGIRRVELWDISGAAPTLVGSRDASCSPRLAKPCPDLGKTAVAPTALQIGRREMLVRAIDGAGNQADRGPFAVNVITPSTRGGVNGAGATETATITARFSKTGTRRRTVRFGRAVVIRGRLSNAAAQPIAGARVQLLSRDLRPGARRRLRTTAVTQGDGTFAITTRARASRRLTVGWKFRFGDALRAAETKLTLRARAAASLFASTQDPVVGRPLRLSGRLAVPARGVTILLQGRASGARGYTTFADTVTGRRGAFSGRYRFRDPASRGRRFVFRAKIKPGARYPFEAGYSRRVHVRVR